MSTQPPSIRVSIIIVSWNAKAYLDLCLASISDKTCAAPWEIIVVDNASTDGSPELVTQKYPHVRLIRNETNLGFAKANNIGATYSRGQYLGFINSDVEVLDAGITRLVDYCDSHPEAGLVGPHIYGADGKTQRSCRGFPTLWNMLCRALALDTLFPRLKIVSGYSLSYWPQNELKQVDILSGCFWLARKTAVAQVGLLDENFFIYGEDMDWCKRFRKGGWKLAYVPAAEAIHYGGASSANDPVRFFVEMQRADLQYWRKHHARPVAACYFVITCIHMLIRTIAYSVSLSSCLARRPQLRTKFDRSLACLKFLITGQRPASRFQIPQPALPDLQPS